MATRAGVEEPTLRRYAHQIWCVCRPQRGYDTGPTATRAPNYAPKCSALSADVRWCSLMCVVVLYSGPVLRGAVIRSLATTLVTQHPRLIGYCASPGLQQSTDLA